MPRTARILSTLVCCLVGPVMLAGCHAATVTQHAASESGNENEDEESGRLPGQGHAMTDVEYHFSNLWFAGQAENWPLAEFYLHETEEGIEWAVHIKPVRLDDEGNEVRVDEIFEGIEDTVFPPLHQAVADGDPAQFETTYRGMMEACLSCHEAADKPFLRPAIPQHPPAAGIEFAPSE